MKLGYNLEKEGCDFLLAHEESSFTLTKVKFFANFAG
jgi:hypothetical protein